MALSVQKIVERKKMFKSVSGYFKTKTRRKKKFLLPLSRGGGGKGLSGTATKKKNFFVWLP